MYNNLPSFASLIAEIVILPWKRPKIKSDVLDSNLYFLFLMSLGRWNIISYTAYPFRKFRSKSIFKKENIKIRSVRTTYYLYYVTPVNSVYCNFKFLFVLTFLLPRNHPELQGTLTSGHNLFPQLLHKTLKSIQSRWAES